MKATDVLKEQHQEVEDLFKKLQKADLQEKRHIFDEIAQNLVAHDAIERQIFYPACQKHMGKIDLLGEALAEHAFVEFGLFEADLVRRGRAFVAYTTVLFEVVQHHVQEEEKKLFPRVKRELGGELLESLAIDLTQAFEIAKRKPFRAPLRDTLGQVLNGAVVTKPGSGDGASRRFSSSVSHRA